jgi:hypothetical protein
VSVAGEALAYARALAWPGVVAAALILFRRQAADPIPRISGLSAAGASVRFGGQATRLAS